MSFKQRLKTNCWVLFLLLLFLGVFSIDTRATNAQGSANWSTPENVSDSNFQSMYPSLASDTAGNLHLMWAEENEMGESYLYYTSRLHGENYWAPSIDVLTSPFSKTVYLPKMIIDPQNYLHVVWLGDGTIYYSSAYALQAGSANGWTQPVGLVETQNYLSYPDIAADSAGGLHIVYAVQIGSSMGIFYLYSPDSGRTWDHPILVSQQLAGDRLVDKPRLAVNSGCCIHVVWVESNYPETYPSLGIWYSSSIDQGITWGSTRHIANGPYDDPGIILLHDQTLDLVWSGTASDRYKFHTWSTDNGLTWASIYRDEQVGGLQGWPALVYDSSGILHWLLVGTVSGNDSLFYHFRRGNAWDSGSVVLQGIIVEQNPAWVTAAVEGGNKLHVALEYPLHTQSGDWQMEIYYLSLQLSSPGIPVAPLALLEQVETATPTAARLTALYTPVDETTKLGLEQDWDIRTTLFDPVTIASFLTVLVIGIAIVVVFYLRQQRN